MGDTSLFWLWFILLVFFLIIWVVVKDDSDSESRDQKKGMTANDLRSEHNFESAAEGALLLLAIPLIIYILFFILVGLVALAQRSCTGCWMWDYDHRDMSV